jgi:hypothetical protein
MSPHNVTALKNTTMVMIRWCCTTVSTFLLLHVIIVTQRKVHAWYKCLEENGGGICPDSATCCVTGTPGISACISEKEDHFVGVCCSDDGVGVTGCDHNYQCARQSIPSNKKNTTEQLFCQRIPQPDDLDIPERLPRYQLCSVPRKELTYLYGLPVKPDAPVLAYYSNLKSLDAADRRTQSRHAAIRTAWIVVHGSKRNADDYLCCALAALPESERDLDTTSILVLSPRFLDRSDGPVRIANLNNSQPLYYAQHGPISHTWRYGADATNSKISSYAAMDAMVETLAFDTIRFPNLERIVVAGHSAGGQFVHRWALTSFSPAWGDDDSSTARRTVPIRAVAANPRSFSYLDERRFEANGSFLIPDSSRIKDCPGYNEWEWGLEPGGLIVAPYKDRAIAKAGGPRKIAEQYAKRKVIYLAGDLDLLPVRSECEDDNFQGPNRRTRSELFHNSLEQIFGHQVHRRVVVPMVHHDHCLLFQSEQGRAVLFGEGGEVEIQY